MKRLKSAKSWAASISAQSESSSRWLDSLNSSLESEYQNTSLESDSTKTVRPLSDTEKVIIREYLANNNVDDWEEDWNLQVDQAERSVNIPENTFKKICLAMGAQTRHIASWPLDKSANQDSNNRSGQPFSPASLFGPKGNNIEQKSPFIEASATPDSSPERRRLDGSLVEEMNRREFCQTPKPKVTLFPVAPTCGPRDEVLAELCKIANMFLEEVGTTESATPGSGSKSSKIERKSNALILSRTMAAALGAMRAHFEVLGFSTEEEVGALAMEIEPALRELLMDERCYKILPAPARALVRVAVSEAYYAGTHIFFRCPNASLRLLGPMLQRALVCEETEVERGMCIRSGFTNNMYV
jgi:hypothetical protein